MRCLIFGAVGQDGCLLAETFHRARHRVVGVSRRPSAEAWRALGAYGGNLEGLVAGFEIGFEQVEGLIAAERPDVVVNVAGMSSVGASFDRPMATFLDNGQLNLFILEALRRAGSPARYVFASSGEVFGETLPTGATADAALDPRSPYAVSKASATLVLRNYRQVYGVDARAAFLFPHESHLRDPGFVLPKVARGLAALAEGRIDALRLGRLDVVRDWGWAPEYMQALWRLAMLPEPCDLVIASGRGVALAEMVRHGLARVGIAEGDRVRVDPTFLRPADVRVSVGDVRETERLLGWKAATTGPDVLDALLDGVLTPPLATALPA